MEDFKLIHLSDLHIFQGSAQKHGSHKHSLIHMKGIQQIVEKETDGLDRLIISGDISHYGDENNLLLAKQWIYESIDAGNQEQISLGLLPKDHHKIRLIPGNHDAWNSKTKQGRTIDIRQKSLENFNVVFGQDGKDLIPFPDGYYYDWVQKGNSALFFVYIDSSFIGDTEIERDNPELIFFDRIGKGKVSKKQAESVLALYDKGMAGKLKHPSGEGYIDQAVFSSSLKVVVMHHYLFEPQGEKSEPLLQVNETQTVFKNFALADIDVLLCGHKHHGESQRYLYTDHFDKRAKTRYMFNYFRRLIGIHSLPFYYKDKSGKMSDKFISALISLFINDSNPSHAKAIGFEIDMNFVTGLSQLFVEGLDNPHKFEHQLMQFIKNHPSVSTEEKLIDEGELLEIAEHIKTSFTEEERTRLKQLTKQVEKIVQKLSSRQFVQVMAGSACKAQENEKKTRSFYIHRVFITGDGYTLRCEKYVWNAQTNDYSGVPHSIEYHFDDKNRPLH